MPEIKRLPIDPESIKFATTIQPNKGLIDSRVYGLGRDQFDGWVLQHTRNEHHGLNLQSGEIVGPAMNTPEYMRTQRAVFKHDIIWQGVWQTAFKVTSDRKLVQELRRQAELRRREYVKV